MIRKSLPLNRARPVAFRIRSGLYTLASRFLSLTNTLSYQPPQGNTYPLRSSLFLASISFDLIYSHRSLHHLQHHISAAVRSAFLNSAFEP